MSIVFISYSRVDSDTANEIETVLNAINMPFFRDVKDIDWGVNIEKEVRLALFNCAAVLVVISPASLKSAWVPYELGHGSALRKRILPFVTHPSLDLPSYISKLSYITRTDQIPAKLKKLTASVTAEGVQRPIFEIADNQEEFITGTWCGEAHQKYGPDNRPVDFTVTIQMRFEEHTIVGKMAIEMPHKGQKYTAEFTISGGLIGGRFAWLNYISKDKDSSKPHFGTIIFDLLRESQSLVGEYIGYGALTDNIVSGYAELRRVT